MLAESTFVRPVRDRAVGHFTGEPQHQRREGGNENRRRRRTGHLEHRREVEEVAVVLDVPGTRERGAQHLDVLARVARGRLVGKAVHSFDDDGM